MSETKTKPLTYLEWIALTTLYQHRDRLSSPERYVGLSNTIESLIRHHPPLARRVGKNSDHQVHITDEGIALVESQQEV